VNEEKVGERDIEHGAATAALAGSARGVGWPRAFVVGLAVFGYFVVLTVWLPSRVLRLGAVQSSDGWVKDLAVTASWSAALMIGLVGLRLAQRGGWI